MAGIRGCACLAEPPANRLPPGTAQCEPGPELQSGQLAGQGRAGGDFLAHDLLGRFQPFLRAVDGQVGYGVAIRHMRVQPAG